MLSMITATEGYCRRSLSGGFDAIQARHGDVHDHRHRRTLAPWHSSTARPSRGLADNAAGRARARGAGAGRCAGWHGRRPGRCERGFTAGISTVTQVPWPGSDCTRTRPLNCADSLFHPQEAQSTGSIQRGIPCRHLPHRRITAFDARSSPIRTCLAAAWRAQFCSASWATR